MAEDFITPYRTEFEKVIEFLKAEMAQLRTGRANPALVEGIQVEAYGARTPLVGLASITTPDARTITIESWDKSVVKDIERAILEANIGLTPNVAGQVIRISLPPLTEEGRKDLLKVLGDKLEHARIGIRKVRDEIKSEIVEAEKEKLIGEDEKYKSLEDLDKRVGEWNQKIREMGEEKEKEIMTI
ncbi:hypothetical protein AMJ57_00160 [Parcubacteria bacterium SG8_24]|nr:MAG: hypothetical protein AMJ57_00160 [Parcubacteria bacterium SG8_24]